MKKLHFASPHQQHNAGTCIPRYYILPYAHAPSGIADKYIFLLNKTTLYYTHTHSHVLL